MKRLLLIFMPVLLIIVVHAAEINDAESRIFKRIDASPRGSYRRKLLWLSSSLAYKGVPMKGVEQIFGKSQVTSIAARESSIVRQQEKNISNEQKKTIARSIPVRATVVSDARYGQRRALGDSETTRDIVSQDRLPIQDAEPARRVVTTASVATSYDRPTGFDPNMLVRSAPVQAQTNNRPSAWEQQQEAIRKQSEREQAMRNARASAKANAVGNTVMRDTMSMVDAGNTAGGMNMGDAASKQLKDRQVRKK